MSKVTALPTAEFNPREVAPTGRIDQVCRRFLTRIEVRGYSPNTVTAYRRDLEQFAGFMAARDCSTIHGVTRAACEDFADALLAGEGNSPRTVHRKLQAVGSMFRFAVDNDLIRMGENPLRTPLEIPFHRAPVEAPGEAAILAVIGSIPVDTFVGRRDRAMFLLMYDTTLRVSGVCNLDLDDLDTARGLARYTAKGGAVKHATVEPGTAAAVEDWLAVRHRFERADSPPALFLSGRGGRMSRSLASQRLKHYGRAAGLPAIHPHLLRHRRLIEIFRHAGPHEAQAQAGHKHLTTTLNQYQGEQGERVRQRIRRDAPIGGKGRC